jgi:hypothetical protein
LTVGKRKQSADAGELHDGRTAEVRVFVEQIPGALIDSARISVMAALHLLPAEPSVTRIVLPGDDAAEPLSVRDCLIEAAQWLDGARAMTVQESATAPTSLHVVGGGGGGANIIGG